MRIFQHQVPVPLLLLAGIEGTVCIVAPFLADAILGSEFPSALAAGVDSALFAGAMLLTSVALGLYSRRQRARLLGVLIRTGTAIVSGVAFVGMVSFVAPAIAAPRGALGFAALLAYLLAVVARFVFVRLVPEDIFKRRVLIYGAGRRALGVSQLRRRADQRGFSVVAYVRGGDEHQMAPAERTVSIDGSLLSFCSSNQVDEVVVAMEDRRREFPLHELLECRLNGVNVIDVVDFLERESGKVRLDVLNPSWIIFSDGFDRSRGRVVSKRVSDVVASAVLLLIASPLMLATILAIKLEDGWRAPVLYRQRRVGLDSMPFDVLKFRSMRVDAEDPGRAVWAKKGDARVTRVGALIRKVRIDELPQIFNVLRGEMSFVGPRPERPEFVAGLENRIPYYRERHCVKPGITGWAQICYPYGSSEQDAAEKLQYDLYYIKNHSLLFDAMILLQTVEVVLWGHGAR